MMRAVTAVLGAIVLATAHRPSQQVAFHLHLTGIQSGMYLWSGNVSGSVAGHATVSGVFEARTSPAGLPIQTHWIVAAAPDSLSFEASLSGVLDPVTGRTHLVGAIIRGHGRGQLVESRSNWSDWGREQVLSTSDGVMRIQQ